MCQEGRRCGKKLHEVFRQGSNMRVRAGGDEVRGSAGVDAAGVGRERGKAWPGTARRYGCSVPPVVGRTDTSDNDTSPPWDALP